MKAPYSRRTVDDMLDELLPDFRAISIEGARAIGKTETARRRAATVLNLETPETVELLSSYPKLLAASESPILIDEWQRLPVVWDRVRRLVDSHTDKTYILTGSAAPVDAPIHSGAGRIIGFRMRPLSIAERNIGSPTVRLANMFAGTADVVGKTHVGLPDYIREIVTSGFPAARTMSAKARRMWLDDYIRRVVEHDFPEQGLTLRRPELLLGWLRGYAASTARTTAYSKIGAASMPGVNEVPGKSTAIVYRDVLTGLFLLDPVPAWTLGQNYLSRVSQAPKHFLADPALAARLLNLNEEKLLSPSNVLGHAGHPDGPILGALFEALVGLSLRTYAQVNEASVSHFRSYDGTREVDFIVHRGHAETVACEVKLTQVPDDSDVRNLLWLKEKMGEQLTDMAVITTGSHAYRRSDGVAVIPLALLGS